MTKNYSIIVVAAVLTAAAVTIAGCSDSDSTTAMAQGQTASPPAAEKRAVDQFALPEGGADILIEFIQKVANPEQGFRNEAEMTAYKEKASRAINAASDRILTNGGSDAQVSDAVGWKMEALNIMGELGDNTAGEKIDKFLDKMTQDKRPSVRGSSVRLRLRNSVKYWEKQNPPARLAPLQQYAAAVKANGLTFEDIQLLLEYGDRCSYDIFATSDAPAAVYKELLPLIRENKDEKLAKLAVDVEAVIRRLELPGKKLEMAGALFDGAQLDWNAYRGKVVLVDFWASDCPECLHEIPSLVRLYRAYHDKGFEIVGVNLDHERDVVKEITTKAGITWPQLFDDNPQAGHWEHPLSKKYAVDSLPRMILVDQKGTVLHMNARGTVLAEQLKKLLGEAAVADADEIPKTVPDGTATEIMAFMNQTLEKLPAPTSREQQISNLEKVRVLLGVAAEKILAGNPTASEAADAIQMKLASLRSPASASNGKNIEQEQFLKKLEANTKPAVAGALAEYRLMETISHWEDLTPADRTAVIDGYLPFLKDAKPTSNHISLVSNLANMAAETGDMTLVKRLVDALLPAYKDRSDADVAKWAIALEGIARRADLPGKQLELAGTFLDGKKLDWASYRGRVVLVDFWASWCGPCRAEMPNVLQNYKTYHDQGFEVIGVCLDDERQAAKAYLDEVALPWPSLFSSDPNATGFDAPVPMHYGITAIPVAILVDRQGKVVSLNARGPELEQQLKKLFGK